MIKVSDVAMNYGKLQAVSDVSFEVKKGTIHGLIGENGAGKTTLIKCLVGIYKPLKGQILVDDMEIYENPSVKVRVGYVADSNKFFPSYRIDKMAGFFKDIYPNFSMDKFKELNQIFKLDMDKRINELSKGQQMRLAFMLNIAANTEVLIMDEPTSGIDAMAKKELFSVLIKEVEERELTVIISSHHINELEKLCDTVTIIKNGKVISNDGLDEVKSNIRKFNYAFNGSVPEEFLKHPKLVSYTNVGNVYTVIFEGITDEEVLDTEKYEPAFREELFVNLEEVFVYANGGEAVEK